MQAEKEKTEFDKMSKNPKTSLLNKELAVSVTAFFLHCKNIAWLMVFTAFINCSCTCVNYESSLK